MKGCDRVPLSPRASAVKIPAMSNPKFAEALKQAKMAAAEAVNYSDTLEEVSAACDLVHEIVKMEQKFLVSEE